MVDGAYSFKIDFEDETKATRTPKDEKLGKWIANLTSKQPNIESSDVSFDYTYRSIWTYSS